MTSVAEAFLTHGLADATPDKGDECEAQRQPGNESEQPAAIRVGDHNELDAELWDARALGASQRTIRIKLVRVWVWLS